MGERTATAALVAARNDGMFALMGKGGGGARVSKPGDSTPGEGQSKPPGALSPSGSPSKCLPQSLLHRGRRTEYSASASMTVRAASPVVGPGIE